MYYSSPPCYDATLSAIRDDLSRGGQYSWNYNTSVYYKSGLIREKEFEDTKGVIRICKYKKKDGHHNGQKNNDKKTNKDLQSTTQKT